MYIERIRRSFAKALSWRVFATITTMIIVYAITGHLNLAMMAGGADVIAKLILYFFDACLLKIFLIESLITKRKPRSL